jgi:hypothetical protein
MLCPTELAVIDIPFLLRRDMRPTAAGEFIPILNILLKLLLIVYPGVFFSAFALIGVFIAYRLYCPELGHET